MSSHIATCSALAPSVPKGDLWGFFFLYWLLFFRQPCSTTSHPPAPHCAFLLLSLLAASTGSWSVLSAPRSLSTPRPPPRSAASLSSLSSRCPFPPTHPRVTLSPPAISHTPTSLIHSRSPASDSHQFTLLSSLLCKLCRSLLVIKGLLPHSIAPHPPHLCPDLSLYFQLLWSTEPVSVTVLFIALWTGVLCITCSSDTLHSPALSLLKALGQQNSPPSF